MEKRVEDSLKKIDVEASSMQREIEKSHIRKLQGKCLLAGAKCCENQNVSAEEVQECIERSQQPLNQVQSVIKRELDDFQQRLQRCMLTCQDKAKDAMLVTPADKDRMEKMFGDCVCLCGEEHLKLLPLMRQRLLTQLPKV